MHISFITVDDFDTLYQIEQQAHDIPWSRGTLLNNQGDHYINLKIEVDNKVIGFAISRIVLDEATLFNLAIDPAYQGKGYGRQLLTALCNKLIEKKIVTLWLEVRESNRIARNLYENYGFNELSVRKNYYPTTDGQREDAIMMALIL